MAPGDDAGAGLVIVGFADNVSDFRIRLCRDLVDQGIGKHFGEFLCHFRGTGGDGVKDIGSIQELRADNKPERIIAHTCDSFNVNVGQKK